MPKVTPQLRYWLSHLLDAGKMWKKHNHANEAAALAFYSLFSLIPILVIGVFVAAMLVGKDTATTSLLEQTHNVTGFESEGYLQQALSKDNAWLNNHYSPLIGILVLTLSATKVIHELRRALSNIFGNPRFKNRSHAALSHLLGRFISLGVIAILGVIIASSVIGESILNSLRSQFNNYAYLVRLINYLSPVATFAAMTIFVTILMRWLPKRPPRLKEALAGGIVGSILIVTYKYALMLFLRHAQISNMFGGALTLALLLLWIYFAMQAILYSAEFSALLAKERRQAENRTIAEE